MQRSFARVALFLVFLGVWWIPLRLPAAEPTKPELVEVRKIWDRAPHNAFTDLIRHKDRWYCVLDRKSTRLNSSHSRASRMPSSA